MQRSTKIHVVTLIPVHGPFAFRIMRHPARGKQRIALLCGRLCPVIADCLSRKLASCFVLLTYVNGLPSFRQPLLQDYSCQTLYFLLLLEIKDL